MREEKCARLRRIAGSMIPFSHMDGLFKRHLEEGRNASFFGFVFGIERAWGKSQKGVCEWANQKGEVQLAEAGNGEVFFCTKDLFSQETVWGLGLVYG